ncbi:hypothetical protein CDAR_174691 [Caerostris darwini]|uniref:Uncharacterized protein n=1 Tax=Caerostris darwini TaxID=1538125 RepID=A0AAV4WW79_9ARAC|nr:hypothetical protein CDAR_174691 [Caerostris darwini]
MKTYSGEGDHAFFPLCSCATDLSEVEVLIRLRSEIGHDESIHSWCRFEGGVSLYVLTDLFRFAVTPQNGYSLGNNIKWEMGGESCANSVCSADFEFGVDV